MSEIDYMDKVDQAPPVHHETVEEEEEILADLYGEPDDDGVFRGTGA